MTDKKQSPQDKTAKRRTNNKRKADQLIKKLDSILYHHSPGIWEWVEEQAAKLEDAVASGVEWINDAVDTYIWDTSINEAAIEHWVRDTFNIPDQEGIGFIEEATDRVFDAASDYEETIRERVNEVWNIVNETTTNIYESGRDTVTDTYHNITERIQDIINNVAVYIGDIKLQLGVDTESALAALGGLPATITGFGDLFTSLFTLDEKTFVDDGVKLIELQKKLTEAVGRIRV